MNIYYIYLFLINFGFFLDVFNISRVYALITLSIGLLVRKWNNIHIKSYDLFYFLYLFFRLISLKNISDILFLNTEICFYLVILTVRIIKYKFSFYSLNNLILNITFINMIFTIIKIIFYGINEVYLGTFGISVGELGAILPNVGIFYFLRYVRTHLLWAFSKIIFWGYY